MLTLQDMNFLRHIEVNMNNLSQRIHEMSATIDLIVKQLMDKKEKETSNKRKATEDLEEPPCKKALTTEHQGELMDL